MKRYLSDTNSYRSTGNMARVSLERICICICNGPQNFDRAYVSYNVIDVCSPRAFGIERAWEMARGQTPAATFALVRRRFIQRLYSVSFFNA